MPSTSTVNSGLYLLVYSDTILIDVHEKPYEYTGKTLYSKNSIFDVVIVEQTHVFLKITRILLFCNFYYKLYRNFLENMSTELKIVIFTKRFVSV